MFENERINVWDINHMYYEIKANIEEKVEDIRLAIKYSDHGDDFIFISTKDGRHFMYSWFCNRPWDTRYCDIERWVGTENEKLISDRQSYIRLPKLFKKEDYNCGLSNKLYSYLGYMSDRYAIGTRMIKEDELDARIHAGWYLEELEKAWNSGYCYDQSKYKEHVFEYLKINDILDKTVIGEEIKFIDAFNSAHFTSKVDGWDGICGKKDLVHYDENGNKSYLPRTIVGDKIVWVIFNGKKVNWHALKNVKHTRSDEWGVSQFVVTVY